MKIDESVILGLDIGTASVGWALLQYDKSGEPRILTRYKKDGTKIYARGSHIFRSSENPKNKEPLNFARRDARLQRRNIERKARRMRLIRNLLNAP